MTVGRRNAPAAPASWARWDKSFFLRRPPTAAVRDGDFLHLLGSQQGRHCGSSAARTVSSGRVTNPSDQGPKRQTSIPHGSGLQP